MSHVENNIVYNYVIMQSEIFIFTII